MITPIKSSICNSTSNKSSRNSLNDYCLAIHSPSSRSTSKLSTEISFLTSDEHQTQIYDQHQIQICDEGVKIAITETK